jgi:hypothetical protein
MRAGLVPIVLFATCSACGDSPSEPSAQARVEARIQDSQGTSVTGTLAGNFFTSVWDGSRWVDLGSPNGITVALQSPGSSTSVHGEQSVPAGSYSRVRLVLQGVTARLAGGSVIGGVALGSDTTLRLGGSDQRAELVASVDTFTVENQSSTRRVIVLDLRSSRWLTSNAVQSGQVEDSALENAFAASTFLE